MKRAFVSSALTVALMAVAGSLTGCDRSPTTAQYDPHLDGLTAISHSAPDITILENQATLYNKMRDAAGAARPAAAPASAPAAAPAAEPSAPAAPPPPPAG